MLHATHEQAENGILIRMRSLIMEIARPEWKISGFKSNVGNESLEYCWEIQWCQTCVLSWAVHVVMGQPLWSKSEGLETFVVTLVWDSICAGAVFFSISISWLSSMFCMQQEKSKPQEVHLVKKPHTLVVLQFRKWNSYSSISNSVLQNNIKTTL